MFQKITSGLSDAKDAIKEGANKIGDAARDKAMSVVDDWVAVLPKLEELGFEVTSFGITMSITPAMEVELEGKAEDFPLERLDELMKETQTGGLVNMFLGAVRTTVKLHERAGVDVGKPFYIKLNVTLSPEIRVFIGQPSLV